MRSLLFKNSIISLLFCVSLHCGCKEEVDEVAVTSVSVSPTTITLTENGTQTVTVTVLPANANQQVTWSISNTSIVTVDSEYLITALAPGIATVTATSESDTTKKASITVIITNLPEQEPVPKDFTFKNTMTKEVLRNYASRAVTAADLCSNDFIFNEDLRMLRRIGAKYIGRAASYSWSGYLSSAQIEDHFNIAEERATKVHAADPEMILQAGVFEIAYKETVNNTSIPAWVFQDFDLPVERRNFRYVDVVFPVGHNYGPGYWGNDGSAVPKIANVEAQMYFYYLICRYIDAGFEAVHIGQAEMMMEYKNVNNAVDWDRVLTLARKYAKQHARRGIILFDAHSAIDSPGLKVNNRLLLDIQAAGLVPNETQEENGIKKCMIGSYETCWLTWIGRSAGGEHPLGFTIDNHITILEFDNYGAAPEEIVGQATPCAFWNWGYDDITWFALQPESYRNEFLLSCNAFLKRITDKEKKQVYFIQPQVRRVITPGSKPPVLMYKPSSDYNAAFVVNYLNKENTTYVEKDGGFQLTVTQDYRANRQSDGCPNGFGQENTIREIFLGTNAPENPDLLKVILPNGY
jgi:hypothetical protein